MIYGLYTTLAKLSLTTLYRLGSATAWLLEHVFRYRRQVVDENLARAFPEMTVTQRRKTRQAFYRHLADTTVEIIAGSRWPLARFTERVAIKNPELLHTLSNNGSRTVVVMTLHQGNWEWMLHSARAEYDTRHAFVYKRLHSESADRFSLEARCRFGAEAIEMRDAARNMIRHRRSPRLIFMVADQSPGKRERAHWTSFLHQQTPFFAGAATIARMTGAPVAFASCRRLSRGHYQIDLQTIADNPAELEESEIIERYARCAETAINDSPEDWLWSNRRWKHAATQPTADSPDTVSAPPPDKDSQSKPNT